MKRDGQKAAIAATKKAILVYCLSVALLSGCMSVQKSKPFAFPAGDITVVGNVIYCNERPFAELRYFTIASIPKEESGSGLVMYYYHADREVWIHPKEGMSIYRDGVEYTKVEDMNRIWREYRQDRESHAKQVRLARIRIGGKAAGKEDLIRSVFWGAKISDDGTYVSYTTQGMVLNSSRKYLVEDGLSR